MQRLTVYTHGSCVNFFFICMYLSVFSLVCLGLVFSDILLSNKSGHYYQCWRLITWRKRFNSIKVSGTPVIRRCSNTRLQVSIPVSLRLLIFSGCGDGHRWHRRRTVLRPQVGVGVRLFGVAGTWLTDIGGRARRRLRRSLAAVDFVLCRRQRGVLVTLFGDLQSTQRIL